MGFKEFSESKRYQTIMGFVYGWGASVVLVGALFKINHWPGATIMLIVGLLTEAFIFFTSAFEPPHKKWDWSVVYPELAGMEEDELATEEEEGEEKPMDLRKSALERFDEMLANAEIAPDLFNKLGDGLRTLNNTTQKLMDVSDATTATNNYVANFEKASEKVNEFASNYADSATKLNSAADNLSETYLKTSDSVNSSGGKLAETYQTLVSSLNEGMSDQDAAGKQYAEELQNLNKNLSALNAVYEMQLSNSNEFVENTEKVYGDLENVINGLQESVQGTQKYKEEISKLSDNLASLNTVYGNMLGAMTLKQQ